MVVARSIQGAFASRRGCKKASKEAVPEASPTQALSPRCVTLSLKGPGANMVSPYCSRYWGPQSPKYIP